ncbi:MAG: hypothetical protein U5J78_03365 [Parasphingorhabdus sp.]|nr:hypothetical protein [Parasphingorhabdus sp.]
MNFIALIEAHAKLLTAIGVFLAALFSGGSLLVSAQPVEAHLSEKQAEMLAHAVRDSRIAIAQAERANRRLDDRGQNFIPCVLRTMDKLVDATGVRAACPLDMPE